ncbi:MAG: eukaryotic-like serine/threonine-protein kinase [Blastocatellia bacterium]|nr:eukaryotic-like serine/threonine-protein kinase [Blastocatellia bacterium]
MTSSAENNSDDQSLSPGTILQQRYRIVRQLGRGGMGAVYEAEDERLGITVALKETLSTEAGRRKQFEHEARLLAGMQHSALPRVSDHFVEGHRAFLVMEFIGGVDLARIIAQQPGPFPRECVIAWADQLLDALMYLHSRDRQVIHRDIKPHNLKLTAAGQIALLDFGLAKAQQADSSLTSSRAFFGYTRHYAPLEQIQDQHTDPRSDIYALGATLYHLLTGTKPPDAVVRATALANGEADPLKPADKIHAAVGSQIAAILNKAMAQKPEDRFANASDFREALRRMGRVDSESGSPQTTGESETRTRTIQKSHSSSPHRVEPVDMQLALVGSAKRFGHGAITAVLVIALSLSGGILYSARGLFASNTAAETAASATLTTQPASASARRTERARTSENQNLAARRREATGTVDSERVSDRQRDNVPDRSEVRPAPPAASSATPRPMRRSVNAPHLRLPNPEIDDASAPAADAPRRVYDR